MDLNDYKVILYPNQPDGWVAEIPAIEGCYALMPTRQQALVELEQVFDIIAAEYQEKRGAEEFRRPASRPDGDAKRHPN